MLVYNYKVSGDDNYEMFSTNTFPVFPDAKGTSTDIEVQFFPLEKSTGSVEYYDTKSTRVYLSHNYTYESKTVPVALDKTATEIETVPNACIYGPVYSDRECTTQVGTDNVYIAMMCYVREEDDTGAEVIKAYIMFPTNGSVVDYTSA